MADRKRIDSTPFIARSAPALSLTATCAALLAGCAQPTPRPAPGATEEGTGACGEREVGNTPLRRLSSLEVANSVRDLLVLDDAPALVLGTDEKIGPFDSNSIALVTDLVVERYMDAAEQLAEDVPLGAITPCDVEGIDDACVDAFISSFGVRAYRRPLASAEKDSLRAVYETGAEIDGPEQGLRLVIQAALQSPYFLYHTELGHPGEDAALDPLTDFEVASRLSYLFWQSMPDDELLAAASDGSLHAPDEVATQAERLLANPRADAAIASFHRQWLGFDRLDTVEKDEGLHPDFDEALAASMRKETESFAAYVMREDDARLETLMTADYSILDATMAQHYGVPLPEGYEAGTPVSLPAGERSGILTQAAWLTAQAHANQSSPIRRGVTLRENLLCQDLPPPPPEVNNTPPAFDPDASTRERFEEHTKNEACASCHSLIDPLGFAFEHYDAVGMFRTTDGGAPVDARGEILGTDVDAEIDGAPELAELLAGSTVVRDCVLRQWFRFALGRTASAADECSVETAFIAFEDSDFEIRAMLLALVRTDAFLARRPLETDS